MARQSMSLPGIFLGDKILTITISLVECDFTFLHLMLHEAVDQMLPVYNELPVEEQTAFAQLIALKSRFDEFAKVAKLKMPKG